MANYIKTEDIIMNEKICSCGGNLMECLFTTSVVPIKPQITIQNGFYNNAVSPVTTFVCTKCGKIEMYADVDIVNSVNN